MSTNQEGKKRGSRLRGSVLRAKLLEILKGEYWLNSLQVCRILNGAKHKHDLSFCRINPHPYGYTNNFTGYGGNPYSGCVNCNTNRSRVYSALKSLEKKGFIESVLGWFTDAVRTTGGKDRMRIWALKGRLPSLDHFTENETKKRTV
ncbi:unnamed protein product [marine sediment metagenome]|uniref:Uncharacterized protein n=1 Tax=marine sediment metagenome TaxID=412755 RepID=X1CJ51_9ZZZZ